MLCAAEFPYLAAYLDEISRPYLVGVSETPLPAFGTENHLSRQCHIKMTVTRALEYVIALRWHQENVTTAPHASLM